MFHKVGPRGASVSEKSGEMKRETLIKGKDRAKWGIASRSNDASFQYQYLTKSSNTSGNLSQYLLMQ